MTISAHSTAVTSPVLNTRASILQSTCCRLPLLILCLSRLRCPASCTCDCRQPINYFSL
uniref:Uncharacterized protein n=1 Tax=Anguilla anguilla TaxID=7936 RepID=A0A0E9VCY7_ANGAN